MQNFDWVFDGIGTAILTGVLSLIIGGGVGYKIGVSKNIKQIQKSGNKSEQQQIGEINVNK